MADLPGILEGAHEGRGLGHRFLRHIERNPVLMMLIPADSADHRKEYDVLMNELAQYNEELLDKKMLVAISKADMLDDELKAAILAEMPADIPVQFFSSLTREGLQAIKDKLWILLNDNEDSSH
jgi:GTP-binding protein